MMHWIVCLLLVSSARALPTAVEDEIEETVKRQFAEPVVYQFMEFHVRLADGRVPSEGRVEVFVNGDWGTVCSNGWDTHDANVVCRSMNYHLGGYAVHNADRFGQGTGFIWMDAINCVGNENRLADCPHQGFGSNTCTHERDAGVVCNTFAGAYPQFPPIHDIINPIARTSQLQSVRLAGSSSPSEGSVLVLKDNEWGSICSTDWNDADAHVVCRHLGYQYGGRPVHNAHYGQGIGRIWIDSLNCRGTEIRLDQCDYSIYTYTRCLHNQDVGVVCNTAMAPPNPSVSVPVDRFSVRLVGGILPTEGRLEVFVYGQWKSVCDGGWEDVDATVVCRQLGMAGGQAVIGSPYIYGPGIADVWMDEVYCTGLESTLDQCRHQGYGVHNCNGQTDAAGVRCIPFAPNPTPVPETGFSVRLSGSVLPSQGRVEVYAYGEWKTVCDDSWDDVDARVVCKELGLGDGGRAIHRANIMFGSGIADVWMDEVDCTGMETSLYQCAHRGLGVHNCNGHTEAAGVDCYAY